VAALAPYIRRLLSVAPGSRAAVAEQEAISSLFIAVLREGGRKAGEALFEALADEGFVVERIDALPCFWRVKTPPPRVLELWFTGGDDPVIGSSSYRIGKPWGSPGQKAALRMQEAFYKRYEGLAGRENAHLTRRDRATLLIGEFEADVNNGGFDQYLGNKGVERARETLGYLVAIGAKRTARWLSAALAPRRTRRALEKLDEQFYERPEDLPSLVMQHYFRMKGVPGGRRRKAAGA
jgi:hypothetical protein